MNKLKVYKQFTHQDISIYGEKCPQDALKVIFKATLLSQINLDYQTVVISFYENALKIEDSDDENEGQCIICLQDSKLCNCLHLFQETNRYLHT